MHIFKIEDIN